MLHVAGKIEDYSLDMRANVVVPEQTDAHLLIAGQGSQKELDLSRIDISALEGKLAGTARLSWKPELKGALDLDGQGLNPGVLLKDWPGKLGISLRAEGGIKDKQPSLQLQQLHVQGQFAAMRCHWTQRVGMKKTWRS